jgi:hypothetical protein
MGEGDSAFGSGTKGADACMRCGKKIRGWTTNSYKDWDRRSMHKSCWKLVNEEHCHKMLIETYCGKGVTQIPLQALPPVLPSPPHPE